MLIPKWFQTFFGNRDSPNEIFFHCLPISEWGFPVWKWGLWFLPTSESRIYHTKFGHANGIFPLIQIFGQEIDILPLSAYPTQAAATTAVPSALLPSCRHHRQATANATSNAKPPLRCCHRRAAAPSAAALPLPPLPRCHRAVRHRRASAAAGPLPLLTPCCRQRRHGLHFHCRSHCSNYYCFRHHCRRCF
jgi:hypothetical protein